MSEQGKPRFQLPAAEDDLWHEVVKALLLQRNITERQAANPLRLLEEWGFHRVFCERRKVNRSWLERVGAWIVQTEPWRGPIEEVGRWIDNLEAWDLIRCDADGNYDFAIDMLDEYFAARHLVARWAEEDERYRTWLPCFEGWWERGLGLTCPNPYCCAPLPAFCDLIRKAGHEETLLLMVGLLKDVGREEFLLRGACERANLSGQGYHNFTLKTLSRCRYEHSSVAEAVKFKVVETGDFSREIRDGLESLEQARLRANFVFGEELNQSLATSLLGPDNLLTFGIWTVEEAFVFALVGPEARPIGELIETYAWRYRKLFGEPLSLEQKNALRQRLEKARDEILKLVEADAKVALILNEVQPSRLVSQVVIGSVTHQGLLAVGAKERIVYIDLELVEGLLALGEDGRRALEIWCRASIESLKAGEYKKLSLAEERFVNNQIVSIKEKLTWDDKRLQLLKKRQEVIGKRYDQLYGFEQQVSYQINLEEVSHKLGQRIHQERVQAIQAGLAQLVDAGKLTCADIKQEGNRLILSFAYRSPLPNPSVVRSVLDVVYDWLVLGHSTLPP